MVGERESLTLQIEIQKIWSFIITSTDLRTVLFLLIINDRTHSFIASHSSVFSPLNFACTYNEMLAAEIILIPHTQKG